MLITQQDIDDLHGLILSERTGPSLPEPEKQILQAFLSKPEGIDPNAGMKRSDGKPPTLLNHLGREKLLEMIHSVALTLETYFDSDPHGRSSSYRLYLAHTETNDTYQLLIAPNKPSLFAAFKKQLRRKRSPSVPKPAPRVFLCHSSGDKAYVRKLWGRLLSAGFQAWLDEVDLIGGQDWDAEINKAVRTSDIVVVCLSLSSIDKEGYVQKEIKFALDVADEKPEGMIYIIPARIEQCDIPGRLAKYHRIDLFEPDGFEKLGRAIWHKVNSRKPG
jgi:hypothetical protein